MHLDLILVLVTMTDHSRQSWLNRSFLKCSVHKKVQHAPNGGGDEQGTPPTDHV